MTYNMLLFENTEVSQLWAVVTCATPTPPECVTWCSPPTPALPSDATNTKDCVRHSWVHSGRKETILHGDCPAQLLPMGWFYKATTNGSHQSSLQREPGHTRTHASMLYWHFYPGVMSLLRDDYSIKKKPLTCSTALDSTCQVINGEQQEFAKHQMERAGEQNKTVQPEKSLFPKLTPGLQDALFIVIHLLSTKQALRFLGPWGQSWILLWYPMSNPDGILGINLHAIKGLS